MDCRQLLIVLSILSFSFPAFCESEVKKSGHSTQTVYLAKSGLEDDEVWDIRWSTDYAIAGSTVIYSEKQWDATESVFEGKIYSIVGPYISYHGRSSGYSEGAAHPWSAQSFETIDINDGKEVALTDLFDHNEIFKALINHKIIKKALHDESPKNLEELYDLVDGGCDFLFSKHSMESFAFHHIKNGKVAIRLGLMHGCEVKRGNLTQLGFYLSIPEKLKKDLSVAQKKGLLMDNMEKLEY
jgi:hypothetical protein